MRTNYLNNRDILSEIHKSKKTYCSFKTPSDSDYDIILKSVDQINKKNIKQARENRADRLARAAYDLAHATDPTVKLDQFKMKPKDIEDTDIVFRIMTWEHIPQEELKKVEVEPDEQIVTEYDEEIAPIKYLKVNFPPFHHYRINAEGEPMLVGKSHWIGPMRSQALLQLSQIGLQFDESKSANPFAYYTAVITNSFTRVLNIEKRNQNIRDDILQMNNYNPSYTRQNEGSYDHE